MNTSPQNAGDASQPSTLLTRQRRQTTFFEPPLPQEKEKLIIPKVTASVMPLFNDSKQGSGARLKDISAITASISKLQADEPLLIEVHRILFKRTGTKVKRKRDIGEFSGFDFATDVKETEKNKLKERIGHSKSLKKIAAFFNVPVKKGKEEVKRIRENVFENGFEMTEAVVEFLMDPKDYDEPPAPKKKETPKVRKPKTLKITQKRKAPEKTPAKAKTPKKDPPRNKKQKTKATTETKGAGEKVTSKKAESTKKDNHNGSKTGGDAKGAPPTV